MANVHCARRRVCPSSLTATPLDDPYSTRADAQRRVCPSDAHPIPPRVLSPPTTHVRRSPSARRASAVQCNGAPV